MPAERLLLCGRKPLNREPEAGAVEITVLRVSEIAPAILIMPPHSYPLCPLATSTGGGKEGERNREKQRERERRGGQFSLLLPSPHQVTPQKKKS